MIGGRPVHLLANLPSMTLSLLTWLGSRRRSWNLAPLHRPLPIADLQPAIASLRNDHLAARRNVPTLPLDLQKSPLVLHHPVIADDPFPLDPEGRIELGLARSLAVVVFRGSWLAPQPPVVIRQVVLPQIPVRFLPRPDPVQPQFLDQP